MARVRSHPFAAIWASSGRFVVTGAAPRLAGAALPGFVQEDADGG
jgi:hypothetical protein